MYDRLYYLHGKYCQQGWVSIADLENISGIYDGYHALDGNGVGTKLFEDIRKLPNFETERIIGCKVGYNVDHPVADDIRSRVVEAGRSVTSANDRIDRLEAQHERKSVDR